MTVGKAKPLSNPSWRRSGPRAAMGSDRPSDRDCPVRSPPPAEGNPRVIDEATSRSQHETVLKNQAPFAKTIGIKQVIETWKNQGHDRTSRPLSQCS
jgi:hypothetical protein